MMSRRRRRYTVALARGVPRSFPHALSMDGDGLLDDGTETATKTMPFPPISFETASVQHDAYVSTLRSLLPTHVLPPSEDHPDCPFVEDAAVAIGNVAVINRMGAPSRVGEVDAIKEALIGWGMRVVDMREEAGGEATCDGGDVLLPVGFRRDAVNSAGGGESRQGNKRSSLVGGRHLFVGLSSRTNLAGIEVLRRTFELTGAVEEVVPVPVPDDSLHLKSIVTHVDERTLLVPRNHLGDEVLRAMKAEERGYESIRLPDVNACNVVAVNGVILAPPTSCDETKTIFESAMKERGLDVIYVDASEFAKCDGALTCKSILLDL